MREILTIVAACIVVALAAALVAPPFVDWTKHSAAIAQRLGANFGGRVALEGPVRLRLLPAPRLTAGALTAERPGLALRARATTLELSAPALLRGAFEFTEIALDHAEVALDPARLDVVGARDARVAVARFQLSDATVRIAGAAPLTFEHVEMSGAADTLAGPFRGQGAWRDGRDIAFSFSTGALDNGKLRGKLSFDDAATKAHVEATGDLGLVDGAPQFVGQAVAVAPLGGAPARASFAISATGAALRAESIDARLGDDDHALNFTGDAEVSRSGGLDARLKAASLDLDRFRAAYGVLDLARAAPALDLRASLASDSVLLGGEALTNVVVAVARANGAQPRYTADAGLPGRTRLRYDGAFDVAGAKTLDGALKLDTRDAGRLAKYVAPAAPQVARWLSAGGVARLVFDGRVRARADGLALDARALDIDRSKLSGAIDWRAATPASASRLTARLAASVIDVDGLPDLRALAAVASQDDLALSLDAQALRVARLGDASTETGRLRLAFSRAAGVSTLDELSVADLGGANLSGSGRATAQGGGFDFKLDADRLADLAQLVRRIAPGPASDAFVARAAAFSPAHLTLGLAMDAGGAFTQLNLSGEAGGTRMSAQASPAGAGRMQAHLAMQAGEAAALLRQAGLAVLPLKGLGGARLEAQGEGAIGGALQTRARLDLAGLSLRFDGETLLALNQASAHGALTADSADVARLAPLFAFGAPDPTTTAPLQGRAQMRIDGGGLALDALDAEIAGARVKGELARTTAGAVSGALALDRLAAPDLVALVLGPAQPTSRGAIWPTLKFAATRFDPPKADVTLDVARLALGGGIVAGDAKMRLALAPGSMVARDLSMTFGEGRISGEVALRREGGAALAKARLSGEAIALAAGPFAARVGGALDMSGAGGSMAELVSSLAGSARLKFADAQIARAAPDALARVVADAEKSESPPEPRAVTVELARALDAGAQTPPPFDSDATIASGRVALAPVALRFGNVDARLSGVFDLRAGEMDVREALELAAPQGWSAAPRIELAWRGAPAAPARSVNADALIAALAERAIARETERNAALEADIHERAFFNRRLKMDRRNDEERRAAEEAARREQEEAGRRAPDEIKRRASEDAKRAAPAQPERREAAPAQSEPQSKPAPRPPAAFAPAGRGVAPDPSTAGRY
ncbi:MAG TPA: AsmA-like C-terminal region-containing protein [Rhodoblastus sp.]|nr:AsmA-like C-terminal region-containing protein [Rhodoblastus sp.]